MNLQEFIEVLDGNWVEVAGVTAKDQCVDLANSYLRSVLKQPIIEWTNAIDFPSKVDKSKFTWVKNTPTGVPEEGDIVIWGGTSYGHIAIFLEGNENNFTSFDQNWPTGSGCHGQYHDYTNVLGWLHFTGEVGTDLQSELTTCVNARNSHWDWLQQIKTALAVTGEYAQDVVLRRIDMLIGVEKDASKKEEKISELTMQIQVMEKKVSDQQVALESAKTQLEQAVSTNLDMQKKVQTLTVNNSSLQKAVQELKDSIKVPAFRGFKKTLYDWLMKG